MVEKSLVEDENWTDGDTVTAAELNNHAAEHNAMYDGTAGEVIADVNNQSVATEQETITTDVVRGYYPDGSIEDFKVSAYADLFAAANAAIEERANRSNRRAAIQLPAGQFDGINTKLTGGSTGLNELTITGHGPNATRISVAASFNDNGIEYQPASTEFFLSLRSFTLDGNRANNTSGTGVVLEDLRDVRMESFFVEDFIDHGVQSPTQWGYKVVNSIFERCGLHGYNFTGDAEVNNGYYAGCRFGQNDQNGMIYSGGVDGSFFGCEFDGNGGSGIKLLNDTATRLVGCTAAGNSIDGYQVDGSTDAHLVGSQANANTGDAVNVKSGATDTRILSPNIRNDAITNAGTRTRINGVIELGAAPTASNYDGGDAGIQILDTSVSPPDLYWVAQDGTLLGPK